MDYGNLLVVHQAAVGLSFAGFFARGLGALAGATWVRTRPARTLPHVVDSVLLLSALAMAFQLRLSPLEAPWLLAKILGLLAYIALGMVALRPLTPRLLRALAWLAALATFAWIVTVAVSKQPAGFFAFA
jgi:uncharacterized membrane protein SirB2